MTCELSWVTFARTVLFVAIGACLLINSLAFFIGWGAVGDVEGKGLGRVCGALVFGAGEGVWRRIACAFALQPSTSRSTSTSANGWRSEEHTSELQSPDH